MIRLSKTSKLDGILSWSLQAVETCPASVGKNGELVPACKGCYATTGNYNYPNVKAPRLENKQDWQRAEWVNDMLVALDSSRYFRFFDSGDMYSIDLAEKILELCTKATWCKFWIPTRMHKFKKFQAVLSKLQALSNVVVRYSSDEIDGTKVKGSTTSVIFSDELQLQGDEFICKAYENAGKCNGCRACYDKDVSVIAYKAHGVKMAKVIKIMSVKG
jgi:predicted metal-binding protein